MLQVFTYIITSFSDFSAVCVVSDGPEGALSVCGLELGKWDCRVCDALLSLYRVSPNGGRKRGKQLRNLASPQQRV